jgi:hypothetical protein
MNFTFAKKFIQNPVLSPRLRQVVPLPFFVLPQMSSKNELLAKTNEKCVFLRRPLI